jgi:hypothetical protein
MTYRVIHPIRFKENKTVIFTNEIIEVEITNKTLFSEPIYFLKHKDFSFNVTKDIFNFLKPYYEN